MRRNKKLTLGVLSAKASFFATGFACKISVNAKIGFMEIRPEGSCMGLDGFY
jgi:hypothetical protein